MRLFVGVYSLVYFDNMASDRDPVLSKRLLSIRSGWAIYQKIVRGELLDILTAKEKMNAKIKL